MSARIFVLCLLSSVISTAASLKCQACFAYKEECKNEDMKLVDCEPDQDYCLALSFQFTTSTPPLSYTYKACATANQCTNGYYRLTSLAGKCNQLRVACCQTDGCNTEPLPIRGRELLQPNGLYCPGSYEENGSSEEKGPVLCVGDETQCLSVKFKAIAISTFHSTVTVQGCATKNACIYPQGERELGLIHLNIDSIECQDPVRVEGWNDVSRTLGLGWN